MEIISTEIEEVKVILPKVFEDDRGYFFECYNKNSFDNGLTKIDFVQDNESQSTRGVLRGLHFQKGTKAQAKLVRVLSGSVLDVAVDIREGSPTFGKHVAVELTAENKKQMFVPRGFAHGFIVLSEEATFAYKCDNYYSKEKEGSINYSDPSLGIDWKLPKDNILVSEKDKQAPLLSEASLFKYCDNLYN